MSWTPADESAFQVMQERRDATMAARREVLCSAAMDVIGGAVDQTKFFSPPPVPGGVVPAPKPLPDRIADAILDGLIANADAIRDALAPYDTGLRAIGSGINDCAATHLGDIPVNVVNVVNESKCVIIRRRTWGAGFWIDEGGTGIPKYANVINVAEAETRCKTEGWLYVLEPGLASKS